MRIDSLRVLRLLPLSLLTLSLAAAAQDDLPKRVDELERRNAELESRLDALADEQEGMLLGDLVPPLGEGRYGLGTAASKVYGTDQGLSLGGYGEALYERHNGSGEDEIDFLRAVLYVGYRFDEHWVFNSELEFEHAGEEVGVEFATLDYLHCAALNARTGLVLIPMGLVNELHEPTAFLGARRPETERRILPSTWREVGAGVFGDAGPVSYRAYVVNGFDATGFSAEGLRDGRQNGSEALAEDLAVVARADWTETPGLLAGGSVYTGGAGQDQAGLGSTTTTIGELHADWRSHGLWLRGLVAMANVDDVAALNAANGFVGADSVGEEMEGMYVEAGYDVLGLLCPESGQALSPYVRFESFDTQKEVPTGFASDPANDQEILTMGLNWRPISNIVFKAEYQDLDEQPDGVNLAMGFVF
jgi:hypothetical protein